VYLKKDHLQSAAPHVSGVIHYRNVWKVDKHLTWGIASRLDSEPGISASGTAITEATKAAKAMSWSFILSNSRE
jgi:hypothetical protein